MAFEVSIKITAESQLEAVKAAESAVKQLGATTQQTAQISRQAVLSFAGGWDPQPLKLVKDEIQLLGPGFIGVSAGAAQAAAATASLGVKAQQMRPIIGAVAGAMGGMGTGARIAGSALTSLVFAGLGPVGIALAAVTIAAGVGSAAWASYQEKVKKTEESLRTFAQAQTSLTNVQSQIALAARATEAKSPFDKLIVDQERARGELKAGFDRLLADEKLDYHQRTVLAVQANEAMASLMKQQGDERIRLVGTLDTELSAITRLDAVQATNLLTQKSLALAAAEREGASAGVVKRLQEETAALEFRIKTINAAEKAARGGPIAGVFRAQVEALRKQAGDIFKAGGVVDEGELQRIFSQFQAIKDISQQQFGFDVPPDLASKLTDTENRLKTIADRANIKLTVDLLEAGPKFTEMQNQMRAIEEKAGLGIKFNVDTLLAINSIKATGTELDALRDKAARPIIQEVRVVTSGSPTLPFSEYFQNYAPGVIGDFAKKASDIGVTLDTNFSQGIVTSLSRMAELERQLSVIRASREAGFQASIIGDFSAAPRAELEALRRNVAFLSSFGGQSGGGGAGGVTVNVDLSHSVVTTDAAAALTRELPQKIASAVRSATGVD